MLLLGLPGCGRERACERCGTIVIAAVGEPEALLPRSGLKGWRLR